MIMIENIRSLFVGIALAVLAFLQPIEGELKSLMIVFFFNFLFGYLSGMIASHEDFDIKRLYDVSQRLLCFLSSAVLFILSGK